MSELFAGTAVLTSTCRGACNLNALHPVEIQNSKIFDLRRRRTQAVILEVIRSKFGMCTWVHLVPFGLKHVGEFVILSKQGKKNELALNLPFFPRKS